MTNASPTRKQDIAINTGELAQVIETGQTLQPMDFYTALRFLYNGAKITRAEWADPHTYGMLRNEKVQIHTRGVWASWIINEGDLQATDWIVVPIT